MEVQKDKQERERIALYGGTFDPVHCAHLGVARNALEQAQLDRVIFIPAAQSPLKSHTPMAEAAARLQMLELALQNEPNFDLDPYEIERGGISYTVETVRHFTHRYPQADLFWIIGGDQFEQLDRWRRIDELAQMLRFLVLPRTGADTQRPNSAKNLLYQVLDVPLMRESSSEVRRRCQQGDSLQGWVPAAVEAFISQQELYSNLD
jgi:nicotinate-nucleotide adenylyltransferase